MSIIDEQDIYSFLNQHNVAVISTVGQDGLPNAAPIYFVVDDNFNIFFITPIKTQKNADLNLRNDVVLTVVDEKKRATVQIRGKASEHKELLLEVLQKLSKKIEDDSYAVRTLPFFQHKNNNKTAIMVKPCSVRMRKYMEENMEEKLVAF